MWHAHDVACNFFSVVIYRLLYKTRGVTRDFPGNEMSDCELCELLDHVQTFGKSHIVRLFPMIKRIQKLYQPLI